MIMYVCQTQSSLSRNIPPPSHYIVFHNVTSDGNQRIIVYDTNVTINAPNDQFEANSAYSMQVVAVNVIGQGPVSEIIFSEFNFELLVERKSAIRGTLLSHTFLNHMLNPASVKVLSYSQH